MANILIEIFSKIRITDTRKTMTCYFCSMGCTTIKRHLQQCRAKKCECTECGKTGHYARVCRSKNVKELSINRSEEEDEHIFNINLFRISHVRNNLNEKDDFKVQVVVNNNLCSVLADTGAKISVCGIKEARKWKLLEKMVDTKVKIKPYGRNTQVITSIGVAKCVVTFGKQSVCIDWHIIDDNCEPVLAGKKAEILGILHFTPRTDIFQPVNMIENEHTEIQEILTKYSHVFKGIGKLKNHQVQLHVNPEIKPVVSAQRPLPYYLRERVDKAIQEMIQEDIIEESPVNEPVPWISNVVIVLKTDGDIRISLDAKNVNKAIYSRNLPITRQEDIKSKLSGAVMFSTLDLKSAFWQLELHPDSRYLTTFYNNEKLYRNKRLSMGLEPAQGELNASVLPIYGHISQAHIIHDNLVVATSPTDSHSKVLDHVLSATSDAGLTFNPDKCVFGKKEVEFWGMIVSSEGVRQTQQR